MKCPHCLHAFHDNVEMVHLHEDADGFYRIEKQKCAACARFVLELVQSVQSNAKWVDSWRRLIHPKTVSRSPISSEVPESYLNDYNEAALILEDSPKASAALSRRCLQNLLQNVLGIKKPNLDQEIQEVISQGKLHQDLLDSLDAVRTIGNFAAHPIKSKSSGEVVDVEPHEAEWNLEVLEMMFDSLFVQPATIKKRRAALDAKLNDAGKPSLK